jgi:hypothetical protein
MNEDRYNIYSIDDILIKVGYVFLSLFILTGGTAVSNMVKGATPDQSEMLYTAALMLFLPAMIFLLIGYIFRGKERVAAAIMHKMEITPEVSVADLMKSSGISRRAVERALLLINRRGIGYYILEGESDRIVDGRLYRTMVLVDRCERCGSAISQSFPVSQTEPPLCPYCGTPVGFERWNDMRNRAFEDIRKQDAPSIQTGNLPQTLAASADSRKTFSKPVFILLLLFFWPAAIIYAAVKYNK